jgi:hypothetical protein
MGGPGAAHTFPTFTGDSIEIVGSGTYQPFANVRAMSAVGVGLPTPPPLRHVIRAHYHAISSSKLFAVFKSTVSNPSLNQL